MARREIWQRFERSNTPGMLDGIRVIIITDEYSSSSPRVSVLRDFIEEMYRSNTMQNHLSALEILVKILKKRANDTELYITTHREQKTERITPPIYEKSHNGEMGGKIIEVEADSDGMVDVNMYELTLNIKLKVFS